MSEEEQSAWRQLWTIATSEPGAPAKIETTDDPDVVFMVWPGQSRAGLIYRHGGWRFMEGFSGHPLDVAARDTF